MQPMEQPSYHKIINTLDTDAEQLEQVYQDAVQTNQAEAFKLAMNDHFLATPDNLLYAAWYYRLQHVVAQAKGFAIAWGWVLPLAFANGLLFWWLSDDARFMIKVTGLRPTSSYELFPLLLLIAAPLSATFVLIHFTAAGHRNWRFTAVLSGLLIAFGAYAYLAYPWLGTRPFQEQYLMLMLLHLPLLAWAGVGMLLIGQNHNPINQFAFLLKSFEVMIMGGISVAAGGLFVAITVGLFNALDIQLSDLIGRLFWAGGGGLIPVVATAIIYNPKASPVEQSFNDGLSKLITLLMRLLLPLTLLVLTVYLAFIPFNFFEPYDNRDVLLIYNGMQFAVIALIVGATPIQLTESFPGATRWLRYGLIALAGLALIVSLYALSAIVYRTYFDRLTPNRLAFIGWNMINIGLLATILFFQTRSKPGQWLQAMYRAYGIGTAVYVSWTIIVILAIPWLFGISQTNIETLPLSVQNIVFEHPDPILLRCYASPHIYLLDDSEKRWIENINTFENRGYAWHNVQAISCDDLREVPDGVPIPADAGPPPQP